MNVPGGTQTYFKPSFELAVMSPAFARIPTACSAGRFASGLRHKEKMNPADRKPDNRRPKEARVGALGLEWISAI